ncbi:hypothetical protein SDC9_121321 [bioreactor metagenome]|uniref:Uncharacterized protein n=1 Tax=bioreactor metagenome TaxID=1076179 RepID=A0A645CBN0_9ZZZZ
MRHGIGALVIGVVAAGDDWLPLAPLDLRAHARGLANIVRPFLRHIAGPGGHIVAHLPALGIHTSITDALGRTKAAPSVGGVMRVPERICERQYCAVPYRVLWPFGGALDLHITQVGHHLAVVPGLLPFARHV